MFSRYLWLVVACGMLAVVSCTNQAPAATTSVPASPIASAGTVAPTAAVLLPAGAMPSSAATQSSAGSGATRTGALALTPIATRAGGPPATSVPILMYHAIKDLPATASKGDLDWTVSPASLEAQLGYLAEKGYVSISLDQLLDGFASKTPLPPKAVVLTFDDGWKSQYTYALPLLKRYKQTATFFVIANYLEVGSYMEWDMVAELAKAGMTIGGHTLDHKSLPGLSAAELDRQLRNSKAALEKKLGVTVSHFAYPNGAFNDTVVAAVKRNGYRSAVTINPTVVKNPVSAYLLPRIHPSYKDTLADFAKRLQ